MARPVAGHTAAVLDGKKLSRQWQSDLLSKAAEVTKSLGRPPGLGVVLVGNRPDSRIYVQRKQEACAKVELRCKYLESNRLQSLILCSGWHQSAASATARICLPGRH